MDAVSQVSNFRTGKQSPDDDVMSSMSVGSAAFHNKPKSIAKPADALSTVSRNSLLR